MVTSTRRFRRNYLKHYLLLAPFFIFFTIFFLWPILYGLGMSVTKWDGVHQPIFVGVANYVNVIGSKGFALGISHLALFIIIAIPLGVLVALGLAIMVSRFRGFWYNFFQGAYFLPFVVPVFLAAVIWRWMFTPDYGIINVGLRLIGVERVRWLNDPNFMIPALVIVDLWRAAGFNVILLLAGIKAIPKDYYEAAHVDGATPWQEAIYITIPLLEPILFLVIVNAFISVFQIFDTPWLLSRSDYNTQGGPGRGMLFPVMDIMGRAFGSQKFGEAAAYAMILLAITLVVTLIQFALRRRLRSNR